jgi:hypothetical protein
MYRPAWRINHTGVQSALTMLQAFISLSFRLIDIALSNLRPHRHKWAGDPRRDQARHWALSGNPVPVI